jgi:hypothetical protein
MWLQLWGRRGLSRWSCWLGSRSANLLINGGLAVSCYAGVGETRGIHGPMTPYLADSHLIYINGM